ncbi:helix-turn-helix domain-containing protein [Actinoplanes sp. CA-030573]|uniref:helix-turn-helix domain-containing protein n=1 Tax=Actinoplanes sp. CA-030573 TaxID=3239898 RepID=UPI003D8D5B0D
MDDPAGRSAIARYVEVLIRLRRDHGFNQKQLANMMGRDPSYISHIEGRRHAPTADFTWRAEEVLGHTGSLTAAFEDYWRIARGPAAAMPSRPTPPPGVELVVDHEHADISLDGHGFYQVQLTRRIRNVGARPITHFVTRIAADAYPGDESCSRDFYERHPIVTHAAAFYSTVDGMPTQWKVIEDRPSYKRIEIEFAPDSTPQPLYQGATAVLVCAFRLHWTQWGDWLGRVVRWPTRKLSVSLTFPRDLEARPAGEEISWFADRPVILTSVAGMHAVTHQWSVDNPVLRTQYRFAWSFRQARAHRRSCPAAVH